MDTILIATDFSPAARNATIYGFELGRLMRAKVILFNACQVPLALAGGQLNITRQDLEKNSYKQLLDEAEALDPCRTIALQTQSRPGPVVNSILAAAKENNVCYIILGMKERRKEIRKYFGGTVTHLYKKSPVPLIVVPAKGRFVIPKTIALATDIADETYIHILKPLKKIGESLPSRLLVIRVIKKSMDEVFERVTRSERLKSFLASLHPSFKFIKSENVAKALNQFVKQHAINMIAVIPHAHSLFENFFIRSVTKDLVFKAHVPVLILPDKNNMSKEESIKDMYSSPFI